MLGIPWVDDRSNLSHKRRAGFDPSVPEFHWLSA